jgi:pyruvate formate lyase activating enzyme
MGGQAETGHPGLAHPAVLWRPWRGGPAVHCFLCPHHCHIAPGERGRCGVRENRDGALVALTYEFPISAAVDPIEKKPLFHFLPGSLTFSIATVGCNFTCLFCQNSDISQMPRDQGVIRGSHFSVEEVVARALDTGCRSISYTYTEPTIFFEYARDCARLAVSKGLRNVFVSNAFMTRQALDMIDGDLHAANIDLKGFSDDYYREVVGAPLKPVLDSIRRMVERGVWVEVTTLLIPGRNDSDEELRGLTRFLVSVNPDIPWHVSRFHPTYRMTDVPPTPVGSIERALRIGREEGLRFVYGGNVVGHDSESTLCPSCNERVIERRGFAISRTRLDGNKCRTCGTEIPLVLD